MALTNCPECNGQISTKAKTCPHCGHPLNHTGADNSNKTFTIVLKSVLPSQRIGTFRNINDLYNIGLAKAKSIVDKAPVILSQDISIEEANRIKNKLESTGVEIIIEEYDPDNINEIPLELKLPSNVLSCPRCGSTAITTGQRGFNLLTGFIGSGKTVNRCGNCGFKFKPRG